MSKITSVWRRIVACVPRYDIETSTFQITKSQSLETPTTKSTVSANMTRQTQIMQIANTTIPAQRRQKELAHHASPDPQHRH
jgi:hypothetical protein